MHDPPARLALAKDGRQAARHLRSVGQAEDGLVGDPAQHPLRVPRWVGARMELVSLDAHRVLEPLPLPPPDSSEGVLEPGAHVLIAGGLGRLGLSLGSHFARASGARLTLLDRRAAPPRARWAELAGGNGAEEAGTARALLDLPEMDPESWPTWLAPHQVPAACRLLAIIGRYRGALLADAVGLGKSYVALAVARRLDCPLTLVWVAAPCAWDLDTPEGRRKALEIIDPLYSEVKRTRPVRPWRHGAPIGKCNQCGRREAIGPADRFDDWRNWSRQLDSQPWVEEGFRIDAGERLCYVCLTKRLASYSGSRERFPSTGEIAVQLWLERTRPVLGSLLEQLESTSLGKVDLGRALEAAGVHSLDAGFPASSPADVEAIRGGARFREVAAKAARLGKPIVVAKVGRSDPGRRAALSHTGSLAGRDEVYDAVFHHLGVIRADDLDEMLDIATAFSFCPVPRGGRVALLSASGGGAVWMADLLAAHGLEVPPLDEATRKGIGAPKAIPRGSYRTLKGGLGWRLQNPPGNRYFKAILIARYQSGGAKFAVFRVL